jgi:hypothetical protein
MFFCYVDESGDPGYENSPTRYFTLGCLLIHEDHWLDALNKSVDLRRYLKKNFNIPARKELKASWILHGKKYFRDINISFSQRLNVYKAAMMLQEASGIMNVFAIVIDKKKVRRKDKVDPRERAWTYAIERMVSYAGEGDENVHILPDEGHGDYIRKRIRRMRRNHVIKGFYGGALNREARNVVGDCSPRDSSKSYFVQFADLNAYAAFRKVEPGNTIGEELWDTLGQSRIGEVSKLTEGPTGIKLWPT